MVTRINKADMTLSARMNLAVKLYSLLRAIFRRDKSYEKVIQEIGEDIQKLREDYEAIMDSSEWAIESKNQYNKFLDSIEYRLDELVFDTKIIDSAGLKEMYVPD